MIIVTDILLDLICALKTPRIQDVLSAEPISSVTHKKCLFDTDMIIHWTADILYFLGGTRCSVFIA